jgi:IgA-specific serine endopeptidase
MPISSGSISPTEDPVPADLAAIYTGGSNFLARMQAMSSQKEAADAALAQLKLGNDVAAAHADAQKKQETAAKLHAEATSHLEGAKTQAQTTINDARAQAAAILDAANKNANGIVGGANKIGEQTLADVTRLKAEAETMHRSAKEKLQNAADIETTAKAKMTAADTARVAAEAAKAQHDKVRTAYEEKMAKIAAVMAPT